MFNQDTDNTASRPLEAGDIVLVAGKPALISHISSDPNLKPALVVFGNGEEQRVNWNEIDVALSVDLIDKLINVYMLSLFRNYQQEELSSRITMTINAVAASSARELAVEATVSLNYGEPSFKSSSLATSLMKVVERHRENTRYEVKALPAS